MINVEEDKHVYFALDSDVLSNLAHLYELQSDKTNSYKKIKEKLAEDPEMFNVCKNYNFYCKILDMARCDKIRFLVTPTPFYESKHVYGVIQFVTDFCYLPKVKPETAKEDALKIRDLAQAYCSPYINEDGVKCKAPINSKYNAYAKYLLVDNEVNKNFWVPSNDAYVLAEASYYGACLITENAKDFLFRPEKGKEKKAYRDYENERVKGVVSINEKYGYYQPNTTNIFKGKNIVPHPYSVETLGKIIAYHEDNAIFSSSDDKDFAYAYYEIDFY